MLAIVSLGNTLASLTIVLATTYLNHFFQSRRDNARWQQEKAYALHDNALVTLNRLMQVISRFDHDQMREALFAFLGALERLSLLCSKADAAKLQEMYQDLRSHVNGASYRSIELEKLERFQSELFGIAKSDRRISNLFKP